MDRLSKREVQVLALMSTGMLNKEIAEQLDISLDTVKKHTKNIYAKLNLRNRTEAVGYILKSKVNNKN